MVTVNRRTYKNPDGLYSFSFFKDFPDKKMSENKLHIIYGNEETLDELEKVLKNYGN